MNSKIFTKKSKYDEELDPELLLHIPDLFNNSNNTLDNSNNIVVEVNNNNIADNNSNNTNINKLKYLNDQLKNITQKYNKLQNEQSIKNGEVTLLRDRLKTTETALASSHLTGSVNKTYSSNSDTVSNKINSLNTEIISLKSERCLLEQELAEHASTIQVLMKSLNEKRFEVENLEFALKKDNNTNINNTKLKNTSSFQNYPLPDDDTAIKNSSYIKETIFHEKNENSPHSEINTIENNKNTSDNFVSPDKYSESYVPSFQERKTISNTDDNSLSTDRFDTLNNPRSYCIHELLTYPSPFLDLAQSCPNSSNRKNIEHVLSRVINDNSPTTSFIAPIEELLCIQHTQIQLSALKILNTLLVYDDNCRLSLLSNPKSFVSIKCPSQYSAHPLFPANQRIVISNNSTTNNNSVPKTEVKNTPQLSPILHSTLLNRLFEIFSASFTNVDISTVLLNIFFILLWHCPTPGLYHFSPLINDKIDSPLIKIFFLEMSDVNILRLVTHIFMHLLRNPSNYHILGITIGKFSLLERFYQVFSFPLTQYPNQHSFSLDNLRFSILQLLSFVLATYGPSRGVSCLTNPPIDRDYMEGIALKSKRGAYSHQSLHQIDVVSHLVSMLHQYVEVLSSHSSAKSNKNNASSCDNNYVDSSHIVNNTPFTSSNKNAIVVVKACRLLIVLLSKLLLPFCNYTNSHSYLKNQLLHSSARHLFLSTTTKLLNGSVHYQLDDLRQTASHLRSLAVDVNEIHNIS